MGDDTPLAVLSLQPRLLYTYFSQLFAQVTNPPIDPIREKLVMSLHTTLGWRRNWLAETPEHARMVRTESPILFPNELESLKSLPGSDHASATVSCVWPVAEGEAGPGGGRAAALHGGGECGRLRGAARSFCRIARRTMRTCRCRCCWRWARCITI